MQFLTIHRLLNIYLLNLKVNLPCLFCGEIGELGGVYQRKFGGLCCAKMAQEKKEAIKGQGQSHIYLYSTFKTTRVDQSAS